MEEEKRRCLREAGSSCPRTPMDPQRAEMLGDSRVPAHSEMAEVIRRTRRS